jgi:hypothetical protein
MNTKHVIGRTLAPLGLLALVVGGCGADDGSSTATSPEATTSSTSIGSSSTTAPASTSTALPVPTSTAKPQDPGMSRDDLARAEQAVVTFVDSLGAGDVDAAAAVVGPVSEERANQAGGLRSMLQTSTEGHGAWRSAADRTVTPIAVGPGLAMVVLEGTLRVEGSTEHRVVVFPARRAESAGAWFAEPWAYDLASDPPLSIISPTVDAEERAALAPGTELEVAAAARASGTVWASFDAARAGAKEVSSGGTVRFAPDAPGSHLVAVLFQSGPTLYASGFRVTSTTGAPEPTAGPVRSIKVPFLDDATNALLSQCAAGDATACDRAQVPGVLDDGAFSYFHTQCDGGHAPYCVLFDNLVAAERRLHGN